MITQIRLQRFKRFEDLTLRTRPLTVLTGTNGSGKTSVLHALLLARQAAAETSDSILLNGPYGLQLGEVAQMPTHQGDHVDGFTVGVQLDGEDHLWRFDVPQGRRMVAGVAQRPSSPPAAMAARDRSFTYLCADRMGPRDTLPASSAAPDDLGVGVRGEFVAHALAVLDRMAIAQGRRHPDVAPASLLHHCEGWLKTVARALEIKADWFAGSAVTQLRFKTPGTFEEWVRPPNMGFGISSVLPIVVAGLIAEPGGLIVVENPEIHLHPAGQSAIGRFLGMLAADGVQVIAETHSDHVVNGMRRAVAEGKLSAGDAVIHYFDADVSEINIDEKGKLSQWPSGFFDQLEEDLGAIARLQRGS